MVEPGRQHDVHVAVPRLVPHARQSSGPLSPGIIQSVSRTSMPPDDKHVPHARALLGNDAFVARGASRSPSTGGGWSGRRRRSGRASRPSRHDARGQFEPVASSASNWSTSCAASSGLRPLGREAPSLAQTSASPLAPTLALAPLSVCAVCRRVCRPRRAAGRGPHDPRAVMVRYSSTISASGPPRRHRDSSSSSICDRSSGSSRGRALARRRTDRLGAVPRPSTARAPPTPPRAVPAW